MELNTLEEITKLCIHLDGVKEVELYFNKKTYKLDIKKIVKAIKELE